MQFLTFKLNEKNKRILTVVFSVFFIVTVLFLTIVAPIQEAKKIPVKTPEKVIEQVEKEKEKENPKDVVARIQRYSIRSKSLKHKLEGEKVAYLIDKNSEVLTAEKSNEILSTFDKYKEIRPRILNTSEYTIEDLTGNPKDSYSCCAEDDNLICTLTIYEEFVRCEITKEEGQVITTDYVLIK